MISSTSPSAKLSPKYRKHCIEATRAKVASSKKTDWPLPPPQPGKQTEMFNCPADVLICGGAAGSSKSFFLLLDAAKQESIQTPGYNGVFFRRSYPQLTNSGCLVPESQLLYREIGGRFTSKPPTWRWATGSELTLRPLQHEDSVYDYQGAQFCWIGFDELTHFSRDQFFYMLSRNRSSCGVKPKVRATCNPDADSWVAEFIQWWWHPETGLPIHERSGVIRYFLRFNDVVYWGETKQELIEQHREKLRPVVEGSNGLVTYDDMIKSFTFIAASINDNPALLKKNPEYVANLNALHEVERQRLLFGNWKIRYEAGLVFSRDWFKIIDYSEMPCEPLIKIRFWDLAATSREDAGKKTCSTAGCLMAMIGTNIYILDLLVFQRKAGEVFQAIKGAAIADGVQTKIRYELEGGASSKILESDFATELQTVNSAFDIRAIKPDKSKLQRALPLATQAQLGHVFLIRGDWNGQFLSACESFDGLFKPMINDIVDSATGAYEQITNPQNAIIISSDSNFVGYLPKAQNGYF